MGTFNTQKTIAASPALIPQMAERIVEHFGQQGFEHTTTTLPSGGCQVSISKGGMFKAALGLKSALNISLTPQGGNVYFDAGIGIFGQQAIPTMISLFVTWPVLITQVWGLVQQSKLDDQALALAEEVARTSSLGAPASIHTPSHTGRFCTSCGTPLTGTEKFCPSCGNKL